MVRRRGSAWSSRSVGNRQVLNHTASSAHATGSKGPHVPALNVISTPLSFSIPKNSSVMLDAAVAVTPSTISRTETSPAATMVHSVLATDIIAFDSSTLLSSSLSPSPSLSSALSSSLPSSPPSSLHSSPPSSLYSSLPPSSVPPPPPPVSVSVSPSVSSSLPSLSPSPPSLSPSLVSSLHPPSSISSLRVTHPSLIPSSPLSLVGVHDPSPVPDVTSVLTTLVNAVPVTVTTVIASATSTPAHPSSASSSFLQNSTQVGAVFGVVSVIIAAGVGFLAIRLYRVFKAKRTDWETENAAREAAMAPAVRLDDDDYERLGGPANPFTMMEYPSKPPMAYGMGDSAAGMTNPYLYDGMHNVPLHHVPQGVPPYNAGYDAFDFAERSHQNLSPVTSRDQLVAPGYGAPPPPPPPTEGQSKRRSVWQRLGSRLSVHSDSHRKTQVLTVPPPLPKTFGEDEALTPTVVKSWNDYHLNGGRVLKIANE